MARIIDAFTQFFDPTSGKPLVNGKLKFLESGTNNTDKTTFKDAAMTAGLENTNPVILDGGGNLAFSVFGSGVYNVILFDENDVQLKQFDPVGASLTSGQFVSWSPSETYDEGDIRRGSDGEYYQSVDNNNSNNNPITSPDDWDLVTIVKSYIANATGTGDVITTDFVPNIHSLVNNTRVLITASAANSSTVPTFAPNGLTSAIIVKNGNQALIAGDIAGSGFQADMVYRSGINKWELLNPASGDFLTKPSSSVEDNIVSFDADDEIKDSGIAAADVTLAVARKPLDTNDFFHIQDQKTSGTDGGTFTAGAWQTRVLNTELTNTITGASLSTNQITLPAGDYYVESSAIGYRVNRHATRLFNTSDTATILSGFSVNSDNTSGGMNNAMLSGSFTLAAPKVLELQHQCQTTFATSGFGIDVGTTFTVGNELYSDIKIWKVG